LRFGRLGIVLSVMSLCLAGGAALGLYCDSLNRAAHARHEQEAVLPVSPVANDPPSAVVPVPAEDRAAVNAAVLRGVRFLKTTQLDTGAWSTDYPVGYAALPALTLLECGVPPGDPNVQKAAAFVRANTANLTHTYQLALAILFLDRLGDPRDRERIRELALRLVAGQTPTGGWAYDCPLLSPEAHKQLFGVLRDNEARATGRLGNLASPLPPEVQQRPVVQDLAAIKSETFKNFQGDNSNTQFAVLALWVARRHEVPLERTAALMVLRFRNSQNDDGSWSYGPGTNTSPATTCAGLLGLAVGQGVALEKDGPTVHPEQDACVQKALAFLGKTVGKPGQHKKGEPVPMENLYVLWSLERVAVLYGLKTIDGKDWYGWAREVLLANQQPKGNWQNGGYHGSTPPLDTCFALLTLLQANLAKDLTSKLQLLGGR
jgi:hypothetical protein